VGKALKLQKERGRREEEEEEDDERGRSGEEDRRRRGRGEIPVGPRVSPELDYLVRF